jgi:hypothetical protein
MGKALPQKSSAEISHEVRRSLGKKTAGREQNGCAAAASWLVGSALKCCKKPEAVRRNRLADSFQSHSEQGQNFRAT